MLEGYIQDVRIDKNCGFIRSGGETFHFRHDELRDLRFNPTIRECWVEFIPTRTRGRLLQALNIKKLAR